MPYTKQNPRYSVVPTGDTSFGIHDAQYDVIVLENADDLVCSSVAGSLNVIESHLPDFCLMAKSATIATIVDEVNPGSVDVVDNYTQAVLSSHPTIKAYLAAVKLDPLVRLGTLAEVINASTPEKSE